MSDKDIGKIREGIDKLDHQLLQLLNERAALVLDLARIKRASGLPLFDPEREREIFQRMESDNRGPLPHEAVIRLFERIIDESRRLERTEVYDKHQE